MEFQTLALDIFGIQPRINRLYTNLTFGFQIGEGILTEQSQLTNVLQEGAERLAASFPWSAGKVCYQDGRFIIQTSPEPIRLVVKDLTTSDFPTWTVLNDNNFPFSMLDEEVVSLYQTLATSDATTAELPVFGIQANFVHGGLLLTFSGQHGAMDMTGLGQLIHLYSKACRNELFTVTELDVGNADRATAVSRVDMKSSAGRVPAGDESNQDSQNSQAKGSQDKPVSSSTLGWAYFSFSGSALKTLKDIAMSTLIQGTFISTNDVLTAFLWISISNARVYRLSDTSEFRSTLSRNVDMRRWLSLPSTYPGLVVESTTHSSQIGTLLKHTLGDIAVQLRSALDSASLIRQFNSHVSNITDNKSQAGSSFAATTNPELDVRLSSWSEQKCYDLDFGFGTPVTVRRPAFMKGAREGLVYFLPKTPTGDIPVGLCLRGEDLDRLKTDVNFVRYGTYIG